MSTISLNRRAGAIVLAVFGLAMIAGNAQATPIPDPLHGFCGTDPTASTCSDNGTITPFSSLTNFGFYASPGSQSGLTGTNWLIAFLVPTNIAGAGSETFNVSETAQPGGPATAKTVTATLVSGTFTSGDLEAFLTASYGLTTSNTNPSNPFSAFQVENNSTVTGFDVYVAPLLSATLFDPNIASTGANPILSLASGSSSLVPGIEIASFLLGTSQNPTNVATAPSGVLLANTDCCNTIVATPEPATLLLFGTGLSVVASRLRRRSRG